MATIQKSVISMLEGAVFLFVDGIQGEWCDGFVGFVDLDDLVTE